MKFILPLREPLSSPPSKTGDRRNVFQFPSRGKPRENPGTENPGKTPGRKPRDRRNVFQYSSGSRGKPRDRRNVFQFSSGSRPVTRSDLFSSAMKQGAAGKPAENRKTFRLSPGLPGFTIEFSFSDAFWPCHLRFEAGRGGNAGRKPENVPSVPGFLPGFLSPGFTRSPPASTRTARSPARSPDSPARSRSPPATIPPAARSLRRRRQIGRASWRER